MFIGSGSLVSAMFDLNFADVLALRCSQRFGTV